MTAMRLRLTTIWRQVMHPLSYVAGAGLTALLIWLLLRRVDFHEVGQALRRADLRYLPPIALLFALRYWLRAVRWRTLVRHIRPVSARDALPRVLLSQSANTVLPFQLGYALMVQIAAEKFRIGRAQLFGAEAIERMMDGLIYALFLALALATLSIGDSFTGLTAFMLFGTFTGFALAWWFTRHPVERLADGASLPAQLLRRIEAGLLRPFLEGMRAMQHGRQVLDVFLLTLTIWCTEAVFYWLLGLSLGVHTGVLVFFFVVAAAGIGGGIPLVQSGIGLVFLTQQALMTVGVDGSIATAYALELDALLVAPLVLLGPLAAYDMRLSLRDLNPFNNPTSGNQTTTAVRSGG